MTDQGDSTSNVPLPGAAISALGVIRAEHQGFATALDALQRQLQPIRERGAKPGYDLFATILAYVDTFMDRFHHPKEDEHLFRAVRSRTTQADAILLDLQHEHARGPSELRALLEALRATRGGSRGDIDRFADLLGRYTACQREHMRKESELVVPVAKRVLTASDWEALDAAFRGDTDPFFGSGPLGREGSLFRSMYGFPAADT